MYKNKCKYILGNLYTFGLQLAKQPWNVTHCNTVLQHMACIELELQAVHYINCKMTYLYPMQ